MRDELPTRPKKNECGILNLDESSKPGSHWVGYSKRNFRVKYFDSEGDEGPPRELIKYLQGCQISFNCKNYQGDHPYHCGHLCIIFLLKLFK